MTDLNAENLETDTTVDGRIVIEPSYIKYIRENGYKVDDIKEVHTVESESGSGAHLVVRIQTYEYPINHRKLDFVEHEMDLFVCDCWSYRNNSVDVIETEQAPDGTCKHCSKIRNE